MNKPIFGAIAVALALGAASNPVVAKAPIVAPQQPRLKQLTATPEGYVIRERAIEAAIPMGAPTPIAIRVGASIKLDAGLLRAAVREADNAAR